MKCPQILELINSDDPRRALRTGRYNENRHSIDRMRREANSFADYADCIGVNPVLIAEK